MRAETAGDPGLWRQKELLGRDRGNADALRDLVRDYVVQHLGDEGAMLVVDETGFPSTQAGKTSCGVARQYRRVRGLSLAIWLTALRSPTLAGVT